MSALYQRTVEIRRPVAAPGVGFRPEYSGVVPEETELVVAAVPCSIQGRDGGGRNPVGVPSDGAMASWRIFTPPNVLQDGEVKNGDLITDDLGRRFRVTSDYCNRLGYRLTCDRLEA